MVATQTKLIYEIVSKLGFQYYARWSKLINFHQQTIGFQLIRFN